MTDSQARAMTDQPAAEPTPDAYTLYLETAAERDRLVKVNEGLIATMSDVLAQLLAVFMEDDWEADCISMMEKMKAALAEARK